MEGRGGFVTKQIVFVAVEIVFVGVRYVFVSGGEGDHPFKANKETARNFRGDV